MNSSQLLQTAPSEEPSSLSSNQSDDSDRSLPRGSLIGAALLVLWLGTRALMLWVFTGRYSYIAGDVAYYFSSLNNQDVETLTEYPLPTVWLLRVLHLISGDNYGVFKTLLLLAVTVFDILAVVVLARRSALSAGYWILFTAAVGPLMWARLDMFVAVAICLALALLGTSDFWSGFSMAIAAGLKLWPAALIAPIMSLRPAGIRRLAGFASTGLALGAASLIVGGWDRSLSPLTWQSDRGLQVESIPATWPMVLHAIPDQGYSVAFTNANAFEVFGDSVPFWLDVSAVAFVVAWVLIALMSGWLWWQQRNLIEAPDTAHRVLVAQVLAVLSTILLLIAVNKTLSPQYLLWLAGPLAFGISLPQSMRGRVIAALGGSVALIAAALTQLIYPIMYGSLVQPYLGDTVVTALLVVRNLILLLLAIASVPIALYAARRIVR